MVEKHEHDQNNSDYLGGNRIRMLPKVSSAYMKI